MTESSEKAKMTKVGTKCMIGSALEHVLDAYQNPPAQFSPVPMWFWNDDLDVDEINRQILSFHLREVDAFMIHPRMGLPRSIPYLSDKYLDYVACAVETAARYGMFVFLYDEAMYPSGSAHGQVAAANPDFAAQALVRVIQPAGLPVVEPEGKPVHRMTAKDHSGCPVDILFIQTRSGGKIRGIHFGEDSGQPDAPPAADLMNPEAMACFINLTHERYYQRLAPWFGTTVQAFFTDEPSLLGRGQMEGKVPWTEGLLAHWTAKGFTPDDLDALFPDSPAYDPVKCRQFKSLCLQRLSQTYYEPLSHWCRVHGIALTGHPSQSDEIGLLRHFQIPGQDLVLRWVGPENEKGVTGRDSTLGKCCADAARHAGRERNAVECFGCCVRNQPSKGWDLPPEDMKWYLDWLAVRGVNLFIPHAFYYSLRGRRAGERPPDVGPAQTWWPEYHYWARYMRRLSHLMTGCVTLEPAAVLCTDDHLPWKVARALFENQLDFNYLEEAYLDNTVCIREGRLLIGPYAYSRILIEDPAQFKDSTWDKLAEFRQAGIELVCFPDGTGDATGNQWIRKLRAEAPVSACSHAILDPLRITCQQRGEDRFILMTNEGMVTLDFVLTIRFTRDRPILWDPWSSSWTGVQMGDCEKGMDFWLQLRDHQSLVLLFPGAATINTTRTDLTSWMLLLDDPTYSGSAV